MYDNMVINMDYKDYKIWIIQLYLMCFEKPNPQPSPRHAAPAPPTSAVDMADTSPAEADGSSMPGMLAASAAKRAMSET